MPVFANGMEISSKSMSGKSICEFPDVCFTSPQTPATPPGVPIPYPNTAMASDTSSGSKSVVIQRQEIMLKNKSFFKKTTGDEAGSAPKKGLMTTTTKGRAYFIAWSMDVKIEGENAVRHLDMTTHNHGCANATGLTPTVHAAQMALDNVSDNCAKDAKKIRDDCKDNKDDCPGMLAMPVSEQREQYDRIPDGPSRTERAGTQATADADANDCTKAMRCFLRPYAAKRENGGCCPGQSGHHIPPQSMMTGTVPGYSHGGALTVCLEGASQHIGSHGENHAALDFLANKPGVLDSKGKCTVKDYNTKVCAKAVAQQCNCDEKCIEDQLNGSFNKKQLDTKVKHYQSNSKQLSPELEAKLENQAKPEKSKRK